MRLIDIDAMSHEMYHLAFETDSDMQKWDGGCWIRYKMFEQCRDNAPTIEAIPISFIENRITELAKERNKYEIGTSQFRYVDMQIYYYEMLMEDWKPTLAEW